MDENRFRRSLPLVVAFLVGIGLFSYRTGNVLWLVAGLGSTFVIFLLSKLGGEEE